LNKPHFASIADVAYDKYFYDIPLETLDPGTAEADYDPQMIENEFSRIEGDFKTQVDELLKTVEVRGINSEQRSAMSYFIMLQQKRTASSRNELMSLYIAVINKIVEIEIQANPDFPKDTKVTERMILAWREGFVISIGCQ